jgi:hypothetical protein
MLSARLRTVDDPDCIPTQHRPPLIRPKIPSFSLHQDQEIVSCPSAQAIRLNLPSATLTRVPYSFLRVPIKHSYKPETNSSRWLWPKSFHSIANHHPPHEPTWLHICHNSKLPNNLSPESEIKVGSDRGIFRFVAGWWCLLLCNYVVEGFMWEPSDVENAIGYLLLRWPLMKLFARSWWGDILALVEAMRRLGLFLEKFDWTCHSACWWNVVDVVQLCPKKNYIM